MTAHNTAAETAEKRKVETFSTSNFEDEKLRKKKKKTDSFLYIDAPAGSGKTKWAIDYSEKLNKDNKNVLIVVPTTELVEEYMRRSDKRIKGVHYKMDNVNGSVQSSINSYFEEQFKSGIPITLAITESALLNLDPTLYLNNWILIMDEASEPLKINEIKTPDSHELIEACFTLLKSNKKANSDYDLRIAVRKDNSLNLSNKDDEIYGRLSSFNNYIKDKNFEVLVDASALKKSKKDESGTKIKNNQTLRYSVYTKTNIYNRFYEAIFMSANFTHTFLYHMYKANGVVWKELKSELNTKSINSSRVTINYWLEKNGWSKTLRELYDTEKETTKLEEYIDWFLKQETEDDYIYVLNNNTKSVDNLKGKRVDAVCHGLNKWRDKTKFMTAASFLVSGSYSCFYNHYGCSTKDARELRNTQMLYQQLMRTDLRNYDSELPISIYVPTFGEACEILKYLPQAKVLNCIKESAGEETGITGVLNQSWKPYSLDSTTTTHLKDNIIPFASSVKGPIVNINYGHDTQYENYNSTDFNVLVNKINANPYLDRFQMKRNKRKGAPLRAGKEFIVDICTLNREISVKNITEDEIKEFKSNALGLFATGQFKNGSTFKANECVGNNALLAFDFDDTSLTDKQLKNIFRGMQNIIYTTPSNGVKGKERRLRVIVICNRTMSLEEHHKIIHYFAHKINDINSSSGLDTTKLTPYSKFFAPHAESIILNLKNRNRQKPLDIDNLISEINATLPKVNSPTCRDLNYSHPDYDNIISKADKSCIEKCKEIIDTMCKGHRSSPTVRIAGICKSLDVDTKRQLYDSCKEHGADENALKSFMKYSNLDSPDYSM